MEIRWKNTVAKNTFLELNVGDIFVAPAYEKGCLFMKIRTADDEIEALDLDDGKSIEMLELEPVQLVKAHVVVE